MKKMKLLMIISGLLIAGSLCAQNKIGYISLDNMVGIMPETAKADTLIQHFQVDSLQPRYTYTLSEYMRKDSIVNGKDSLKTPAAVREQIRREMQNSAYELQNWQAIAQQAMENKQSELLAPIYKKVIDAIKEVSKEKGYTHVFNKEVFLVAPDADDILPLVAQKLKVTLPPQVHQGLSNPVVKPNEN
ncbi:MAG: OmpH family outer membrane protein [Bacteroidetes bacterium]|nr:OmpH family outer membrane protein [Bacteroidota bacterium]MBS1634055.1 OmpH family outer membrane protein [Bacteroidota bacterium]